MRKMSGPHIKSAMRLSKIDWKETPGPNRVRSS